MCAISSRPPLGNTRQLNDDEVTISKCPSGRCKLRRNSKVTIEMKLNPSMLFILLCFAYRSAVLLYALCITNVHLCAPTLVSSRRAIIAEHKVKSLTTSVYATIAGIPLPFIGVDGTGACDFIYAEDGKTKVGCPMEANKNYVYRRSFDVLSVYPKLSALDVHWALTERNNKDLACFELPAKIV